jgi:hypothetical protein
MKPEPPPNRGRIIVTENDLAALKFWTRVFELDGYIASAQASIVNHAEAKSGSVPIISEYHCGKLHWCYVLVLDIDSLGLAGGIGIVYYADEAHFDEVRQSRDQLADHLMSTLRTRVESGQIFTETAMEIIPPGEQT